MKKFFILYFSLVLSVAVSGFASAELRYDLIYKDTPILDYMYEDALDPEEDKDYDKYVISPYTLVRLPLKLRNKNISLRPGYYLVKPEKKSGYEFVIFKQNGAVVGAVPVYQKLLTNPLEVFPEPPKPKIKWYKKPFHLVKNIFLWPFKKLYERKQPPLPKRAKIEHNVVGNGQYYEMRLFVGNSLYKMLFMIE